MSRTFHKADQLQSLSDVIAESCLVSQKYVVFQDIILMHDGELKTYKLKADHVPTKLSLRDSSIQASDAAAHTVYEWLKYSAAKGWFFEVHEVFPEMYLTHDFDEMKIGEHGWSPEIIALQSQVTALDATFSTDIERQVAVTNLQNQIDSNDVDIAAEIVARQGAIAQEVIDRDAKVLVEETRALAAESQEVSDRQAAIAQEVIDRDAKVLVEETRALAAEAQEVSDRQSAVSGVQANVDAEATTRASADTSLTQEVSVERGRLDALFVANDVNFDTIREISDAFAQVSSTGLSQAIALNTLKRSYLQAEEDKVTANALKISYDATASGQVAANVLKRSYLQAEEDKVTANSAKDGITTAQAGNIVTNSGKITYDDAALVAQHTSDIALRRLTSDSYSQSEVNDKVMTAAERLLLNTTHVNLHAAHAVSLAAKQDTLNTSHLTIDTTKSHVGIRETNPETILEIPYKNSNDKCVWLGHRGINSGGNVAADTADAEHRTLMLGSRPSGAWATLGFQVQNTDKATIDYNAGEMSFYIYDSSASAWDLALQLRKDGAVLMPNLPTESTGLAVGQLWNNGGVVNVT